MAEHAEDPLRGARIAQVVDLALAISASEAAGAEGLVAREYGEVLDLVAAGAAAVGALVADERAIAEEEEIRIRVQQRLTGVASKAIDVPSVPG